jgi:hypothetical protein
MAGWGRGWKWGVGMKGLVMKGGELKGAMGVGLKEGEVRVKEGGVPSPCSAWLML